MLPCALRLRRLQATALGNESAFRQASAACVGLGARVRADYPLSRLEGLAAPCLP